MTAMNHIPDCIINSEPGLTSIILKSFENLGEKCFKELAVFQIPGARNAVNHHHRA